jgi:hypothetical protein
MGRLPAAETFPEDAGPVRVGMVEKWTSRSRNVAIVPIVGKVSIGVRCI